MLLTLFLCHFDVIENWLKLGTKMVKCHQHFLWLNTFCDITQYQWLTFNLGTKAENTIATSKRNAPTLHICMTHFRPLLSAKPPKIMAPRANPTMYDDLISATYDSCSHTKLNSVVAVLIIPLFAGAYHHSVAGLTISCSASCSIFA